jgi:hypothetical protein
MKKSDRNWSRTTLIWVAAVALILKGLTFSAQANVYASNVQLNGGATNLTVPPGTAVTVSYILNEPASLGVTLNVESGTTVIRTLRLAAGNPGTLAGSNSIEWDGLDSSSNQVPTGTYSFTITAHSSGYAAWTQITDDNNPANSFGDAHGIAVDRNTNSPYYGRVFLANSFFGGRPGAATYDVGILAFNADGSTTDPNMPEPSGYTWSGESGNGVSPWKVKVSGDDFVYASETVNGGLVYRWDPTVSSNTFLPVLRSDNRPGQASLSGPWIFGTGTNLQIWMCDTNPSSPSISRGVLRWIPTATGDCATNDTGQPVIAIGGSLTVAPSDVATDPAGNIYICQYTSAPSDPIQRVFRFPAYDPSTNGNTPELTADWAIGAGDDTYGAAGGIAVDPTGTYVAVAFVGTAPGGDITNGNTKIFYATNGALVTNLDLGIEISGYSIHQDTDCAWDAVGNLYYIDDWYGSWRAISPPGTNQSTTLAPATVQVGTPVRPLFTQIVVTNGTVTLNFTGGPTDSAGSFTLQSASAPSGPYTNAAGAHITQIGTGVFQATVPLNGPIQYYRLQR